jgi:peptide/nickel transport system ATP-binding protein
MTALMEVRDLSLAYRGGAHWSRVLRQVSFSIGRGEVLGLVGESGCGKSTAGLALLGYLSNAARVDAGQVLFDGQNLLSVPRSTLDALRGNRIGFVPQNPTTALNPAIRVGEQIAEPLRLHKYAATDEEADIRTRELLGLVGLPNPQVASRRFPHELSGGQQQRVCIAIALACEPELVILDEPTTGLDVTTQQQIISLLLDLRSRLGTAMLYVTHDLGLLGQIADRIGVMYAGHLIELATTAEVFSRPRHPYTRGLIGSVPRIDIGTVPRRPLSGMLRRQDLPTGCPFAPRCDAAQPSCASNQQRLESVGPGHEVACERWREIRDEPEVKRASGPARTYASRAEPVLAVQKVTIAYGRRSGLLGRLFPGRPFVAVNDVSFDVAEGETYALVGESGSGKSTLARVVSGLLAPVSGTVTLEGKTLAPLVRDRSTQQRRRLQFIFQNPDASLNPRARVGAILTRPLEFFFGGDGRVATESVAAVLADVRLEANYARRFPDQLSGGERQRVAIARALVAEPVLLLCDEILSALDVSVQASIIELLRTLKAERKVALLFISHDLAVVRSLADRVGVLLRGELMETGPVEDIFQPPYHPYTLSLLQAVPRLGTKSRVSPLQGESIEQAKCAFAGRCAWQLGSKCIDEAPPWRMASNGLAIRCHIPANELVDKARAAANKET